MLSIAFFMSLPAGKNLYTNEYVAIKLVSPSVVRAVMFRPPGKEIAPRPQAVGAGPAERVAIGDGWVAAPGAVLAARN